MNPSAAQLDLLQRIAPGVVSVTYLGAPRDLVTECVRAGWVCRYRGLGFRGDRLKLRLTPAGRAALAATEGR